MRILFLNEEVDFEYDRFHVKFRKSAVTVSKNEKFATPFYKSTVINGTHFNTYPCATATYPQSR